MNAKYWLISAILVPVLGMPCTAAAEGEMDNAWFSFQAKATLKKYAGVTIVNSPPFAQNIKDVKYDSGKDCYMNLQYQDPGSHQYTAKLFCNPTGNDWERQSSVTLYDFADGSSGIWNDQLSAPANGRSIRSNPDIYMQLSGGFRLIPKLKGSAVKSISVAGAKDGMIYIVDHMLHLNGTATGSWNMKFTDSSKVPLGATICQSISDSNAPSGSCD